MSWDKYDKWYFWPETWLLVIYIGALFIIVCAIAARWKGGN